MRPARFRRPEVILLIALSAASASRADAAYLWEVPVSGAGGLPSDPTIPIRVTLIVRDGDALARGLPRDLHARVGDGRVTIDVSGDWEREGRPEPQHMCSSFLVDFEEAAVRDLAAELGIGRDKRAPIGTLVTAAHRTLASKTGGWGWPVASLVAKKREGDCTEHAVLLTALARLAGRPARIGVGIVLVSHDSSVHAAGHAWAEIHDGTRWRLADATGIDREKPVRYLPLTVLDDEGPGFGASLLGFIQAAWPKRIELGDPGAASPGSSSESRAPQGHR